MLHLFVSITIASFIASGIKTLDRKRLLKQTFIVLVTLSEVYEYDTLFCVRM